MSKFLGDDFAGSSVVHHYYVSVFFSRFYSIGSWRSGWRKISKNFHQSIQELLHESRSWLVCLSSISIIQFCFHFLWLKNQTCLVFGSRHFWRI